MENHAAPLNLKASIHIGASLVSFLVLDSEGHQIDYLEKSTSLAHDIFSKGLISRTTIEQCVTVLSGYISVLSELGVSHDSESVRIVAANIVLEASNRDIFINRLQVGCGVSVDVLDDGEMTRLVYMKVRRHLMNRESMQKKSTLVIHVGPGNTRILFLRKGKIQSYHNYRIGTHRIGEAIRNNLDDEQELWPLMSEYIMGQLDSVIEEYGQHEIDEVILIGYEIQTLSMYFEPQSERCYSFEKVEGFAKKLAALDDDEIVSQYNVTYQTMESLVPALTINALVLKVLSADCAYIPSSDYDKGLLRDLHISQTTLNSFMEEVIASAFALAKKYRVNTKHAKQVAKLSLLLFDKLQALHKLDAQDRLLLHCAALLHESGEFVSYRAHHKHSLYLIMHSDIFGLSKSDILLVAIISRYHRNSPPKQTHLHYSELTVLQKMRVSKIASILRIADALDHTHMNRVNEVEIKIKKRRLDLHLIGVSDVSVERMSMKSKGTLFDNIFGLSIRVNEDR